ncbi:MAG: hypothetical protein ACPL2N_07520 [Candidatus Cryosericum sp.]
MKVILSRKGCDSGYGGWASPVLPDARMLSLPIPAGNGPVAYDELSVGDGRSYLDVMRDLRRGHGGRVILSHGVWTLAQEGIRAHLDPDLAASVVRRLPGWRGMLGQANAASSHLLKHQVGPGDLFLFFGRFRHTTDTDGRLSFGSEGDMHAIFGYLLIGEVWEGSLATQFPAWARAHPHVQECFLDAPAYKHNQIFVAAPVLPGTAIPGWGRFLWDERLRLTRGGSTSLCEWSLPECFRSVTDMTYHQGSAAFGWHGDTFRAAQKGQEFIIPENHSAVQDWAARLVRTLAAEH